MTLLETLTLITVWCGTPTPYRLETKHVNVCRDAFIECVGMETLAKSIYLGPSRELEKNVLRCAKERKLQE